MSIDHSAVAGNTSFVAATGLLADGDARFFSRQQLYNEGAIGSIVANQEQIAAAFAPMRNDASEVTN